MTGTMKIIPSPNLRGGACAEGQDPDLWFIPDNYADFQPYVLETIRKICATCPIALSCARHGVKYEVHGVWGGMTVQERSTLSAFSKRNDLVMTPRKVSVDELMERLDFMGLDPVEVMKDL